MGTPQEDFEHDFSNLKGRLFGAKYYNSVKALDFTPQYHKGFRKDGVTPNFHHQVKIAFTAYDDRELIEKAGLKVDDVIAVAILHDTYEDNQDKIHIAGLRTWFNPRIAMLTFQLSKIRDGVKIPTEQYYNELLDYPEALIVKLYDRRNNVETMTALSPQRFTEYVTETRHLLEVAKLAVTKYPKLEGLLQHSRTQLKQYLNIYLATIQMAADDKLQPYIEALQKAGHIRAPERPKGSADPSLPILAN